LVIYSEAFGKRLNLVKKSTFVDKTHDGAATRSNIPKRIKRAVPGRSTPLAYNPIPYYPYYPALSPMYPMYPSYVPYRALEIDWSDVPKQHVPSNPHQPYAPPKLDYNPYVLPKPDYNPYVPPKPDYKPDVPPTTESGKTGLSFGESCISRGANDQVTEECECAKPLRCCRVGWFAKCHHCCDNEDCKSSSTKPYCESGKCIATKLAYVGQSCAKNPCKPGFLTCCSNDQICKQCCTVGNTPECPERYGREHFCKKTKFRGFLCMPKNSEGSVCNEDFECESEECINDPSGNDERWSGTCS